MNFKRTAAILLSVILLSGVFPISAFAAARTLPGMIDELEISSDPEYVNNHTDVLEALYEGYMNHEESIDIAQYQIPVSEHSSLFSASIGVYPELFFVDYSYDALFSGSYLTAINPQYIYTAEATNEKLSEFYAKADEYLACLDDSMDDFTKALILHDQLALNSAYLKENSNNYTLMVEGWGRCENYAECYAYLLAQVGIKSEIINSDTMGHEWMKLKLDGSDYYYNVDLTYDDPVNNDGSDRPGKVSHSYFLLSDDEFQNTDDATYRYEVHTDYEYINASDDKYDEYDNLHSLDNAMYYINGGLYTLYKKDNKGYISVYNHENDTFDDKLEISDIWSAGGNSHWVGNFSGIAEHENLLYFNGENCVYVYDPVTDTKTTLLDNVLDDGNQLYGLYEKDGKLYGLEADNPNNDKTSVELYTFQTIYTISFNAGDGSGEMESVITADTDYLLPDSGFTAPEGKMFGGWTDEDGNVYQPNDTMALNPEKHNYTLTASWVDTPIEYTLVEKKDATVTSDGNIEYYEGSDGNLYTLTDNDYTEITPDEIIIPALNKKTFDATSDVDTNITKFFESNSKSYTSLDLLGVQLKTDISKRDVRFITVVNSQILSSDDVEDYGYIFSLTSKDCATAKQRVGNLTVENANHIYSCAGTSNTFCEGGYGSADFGSTDYKYVTAAVNDIPEDGGTICARFFITLKSGETIYAGYTEFDGCAFNFEEYAEYIANH